MALNKYMHPRNIYKKKKPDFKDLAIKYSYFREKVTQNLAGNVVLDFKDPEALRALTRALLEDDFGLKVTLPLDRLIPTVPQRLNYILWLEDIVGRTETPAHGIDIGTGASCIYPLLGCKQNGWHFLASELDDQNIHFAKLNIANNMMEDKIRVKQVTESTILQGLVEEGQKYDFCMCNPPFFTDHLESQGITHTRTDDRPDPHSISTASECESVAWGGEVRFVRDMMDESLKLQDQVRVYTSLLGRKMSLSLLKDELHKRKITNYSSTEFCQGKTMRWGIAWSFDNSVQFPKSAYRVQKNTKPPVVHVIPSSGGALEDYTVQAYTQLLRSLLDELKINHQVVHSGKFYTCMILQAKENNWSHQRRKRRQLQFNLSKDQSQKSEVSGDADKPTDEVSKHGINLVKKTVVRDSTTVAGDSGVETNGKSAISESKQSCDDNVTTTEIPNMETTIEKEEMEQTGDKAEVLCGSTNVSSETPTQVDNEAAVHDQNKDGNDKARDMTVSQSQDDTMEENGKQNRKRSLNDMKEATEQKRFKPDTSLSSDDCDTDRGGATSKSENNILEHFGDIEKTAEIYRKMLGKSGDADKQETSSNTLDRKEVIERFWKEKSENKKDSKKRPKSIYEKTEPFNTEEECLVLCKMVIRKDEGVITFCLTYMAGNKESMHQIMQFFQNKFVPPKIGAT